MYKTIVERKVRNTFAAINAGNYQAMIDGLAPEFEYTFLGEHPLGGRRTTVNTMDQWWQRVFRLVPGAEFVVHDVVVQGHPVDTRIAVRCTIKSTLLPGEQYSNEVMQFMRLRLGKITSIETLEDTARLERFMATLDPSEYPDAIAEPLAD